MFPLLAPVFAQLIGLQLADRTEGRYIKYGGDRLEAATTPSASLFVSGRQTNFRLSYAPNLLLEPDGSGGHDVLVFHQASALVAYRLRHTAFALSSSFSIGDVNFRVAGLQGLTGTGPNAIATPGTPTDTGGAQGTDTKGGDNGTKAEPSANGAQPGMTGTTNPNQQNGQLQVSDHTVRFYSSTTGANVTHQLSRDAQLSAQLVRVQAGGLNAESRFFYPRLSAWTAGGLATYIYRPEARDAFASTASLLETWSSDRNRAATLNAIETWVHQFDKRTYGSLGAGINITRFSLANGLEGFSIFPSFQLSFGHRMLLAHGTLTLSVNGYSTPALDPLRALVDPRIGVGGGIDYTRKRFSLGGSGSSAVSVAPSSNRTGAVNATQAEAHVVYRVAKLAQVDGGTRYLKQAYQGVTVIPPTWSVYVGLTFGYRITNAAQNAQ